MPLTSCTDTTWIVVLCHIQPLLEGIPQQNWQRQPHKNHQSQPVVYRGNYNWGRSHTKTHSICHLHSWHIWIPNPSPHTEPYCPSMVHQKLDSRQAVNRVLDARDSVSYRLVNQMGIKQPDCRIKTLVFKFVVDYIENSIQYWSAIIWIKDFLTILQLLLNIPWTIVCFLFILNDLFQLLWCKVGRWDNTPMLLTFIKMLGIPLTSNHSNEYIWMEYNQFYYFNQNLH